METAALIRSNLDNTIGFISDSKVVIHQGKESNVIRIEEIKKVNLTKKRRYEVNLIFLFSAALVTILLLRNFHLETIVKQIFRAFVLIAVFLGVFYKSYRYQLHINMKDKKIFVVKKSGFKKDEIKNFYYSIRKKLRTSRLET